MRACFILVALLYICGPAFSQECVSEVLENIDFPGTDLVQLYSPDVEHCQLLCTQHPSCLFFTFVRADWTRDNRHFYCYLKSTPSGQPEVQKPLLGVTSGYSLKPCSPDSKPCLSKVYQNVDFFGADYQTLFTADYEECQRACTHDPSCQFFTFVNGLFTPEKIRFSCFLKSNPNEMVTAAKDGVTSGIPARFCLPDNSWVKVAHEGIDFRGSDVHFVLLDDTESCQTTCTQDPNCQFYAYVNESFSDSAYWRRCYLKRTITMPAPPKVSKLANVVSGFSQRNC